MKVAAIGIISLLVLATGLFVGRTSNLSVRNDETFTGKITDSICVGGPHIEVVQDQKNCILTCVKFDGAEFVLYNYGTKRIFRLDDQKQPEAFAGQEVIVTGRYDREAKAIHVINIRPKITYAVM